MDILLEDFWKEKRPIPDVLYMAFSHKDGRNCGKPATRLDERKICATRPTPTETKCSLSCGPSRGQCLPKLEFRHVHPSSEIFLGGFSNASIFSTDSPRCADDLLVNIARIRTQAINLVDT